MTATVIRTTYRWLKGLLIPALTILIGSTGLAQQYPVIKYGTYEGLSNFGVVHLHQDLSGSIWMGTYWGINYLNKERRLINHQQDPQLPEEFMDYIEFASTPEGVVWAASNRLFRFQLSEDKELQSRTYPILFEQTHDRPSAVFLTADQTQVWFSGRTENYQTGAGLYCLLNGKAQNLTRRYFVNPNQRFRGLQADWAGRRLLVLTEEGELWEIRNHRLSRLPHGGKISRLLRNPLGKIYCFADSGLYRIDGDSLRKVYNLPTSPHSLRFCAIGLKDDLVYSDANRSVCWYNGKALTRLRLSIASPSHFIVDRQGSIWVATLNGVVQIVRNGWQYFEGSSGRADQIMAVSEDAKGVVWFSSWGNGLGRLADNAIVMDSTYFRTMPTKHFYSATHRDADGNLLFSPARKAGILWYNGKDYRVLPGSQTGAIARGFYDDVYRNRYIFSTQKGLYIYNRKSLVLDRVVPAPGGESYDVEVDKYGRFWSGGFDTSYVWDGQSNRVQPLRPGVDFPFKKVYDIQRDQFNNLWFATDQGLWFYDYKRYRRIAGSYLQRVVMFCRPAGHFLLLGTVEGLYALDMNLFYRQKEEWIAFFDRENGFIGNQCIPNGIFRDSRKHIWVATRDRVMMIPEHQLRGLLNHVPTGIRLLRDARTGQLIESYSGTSRLRSNQNDLEIRLWEPDEHNMLANSTYMYRLERLDDSRTASAWSSPTRSQSVFLKNLSDGTYRLTVKVVRAQGLWKTRPIIHHIIISPPWWTTWWFRTLSILTIAVGLFYRRLWQIRTRAQRRQQILETQRRLTQLELEAATRQKHEAQMQQELAEAARRRALLEVKAITNQIDPHFISNFLTAIQSIMYEQDTNTAASYLAKFGAIFRSQLLSRSRVFWSLREELDFVRNYLALEQLRFGHRVNFTIHTHPDVPMETSLPKMLIQGYVSNAIKHGLEHKPEGGTISIDVFPSGSCLFIRVEDNGVGLEKAKQYRGRSTGQGLAINQAVFNQLNQYNSLRSWQRIADLTGEGSNAGGVRMEACLPIHPMLPPEENAVLLVGQD